MVPGLAEVVDAIGDPELTWPFLTQEWPFEGAVARPFDLLKAGRIEEVPDAAPGFGTTYT